MSQSNDAAAAYHPDASHQEEQQDKERRSPRGSTHTESVVYTDTFDNGFQAEISAVPYSARQFPMDIPQAPNFPKRRTRSPGLKWYKRYDTPESLKGGRVLVIDYIKKVRSKEGMRKVAAQEINSIQGLRKLYSNPDRCEEAVLRVMHVQGADWATRFLLRKYNINARDDLVGTDFGKYVKYKRPERRGGKPFLSGKTWKATHDPWRKISRTSFGLDYLKHYACQKTPTQPQSNNEDKMFELNYYDEDDNPRYNYDVFVQRLSCYIQLKESVQGITDHLDVQNPYIDDQTESNTHKYIPRLDSLDNGSTIIIFENSQTSSIYDTLIAAREYWESRWRRLPFYLAYEGGDASNDDGMALECTKIVLQDVWKSVSGNWEDFLDVCGTHVSILEDKIYDGPADETRAPELWTNSSMWLKVERLSAAHLAIAKEMQTNLHELTGEQSSAENWLEATPSDMEKIKELVQDALVKPTANLSDLMYKSVGIRDSRHSLQLSTSMWRLSWVTFIFLPLTFISSFFGMNVDTFQPYPSIKWYFISVVPMMIVVLVSWYFIKHVLARQRQTPYQRGIYETMFYQMATAYPRLWSRSGPRSDTMPQTPLGRFKWRLILYWNSPAKTIKAGPADQDAEYDDLGAWSRFKRTLTRRWTSQILGFDGLDESTTTLEDTPGDQGSVADKTFGATTELYTPATAAEPASNRLEVPVPYVVPQQRIVTSRPSSAGKAGSKASSPNRNSEVMVEEEPPTWLRDYGANPRRRSTYDGHIAQVSDDSGPVNVQVY